MSDLSREDNIAQAKAMGGKWDGSEWLFPSKRKNTKSKVKSVAKKMNKRHKSKKGSSIYGKFEKQLDKHKAINASLNNGTWKPAYKGQSFIEALEKAKADKRFW